MFQFLLFSSYKLHNCFYFCFVLSALIGGQASCFGFDKMVSILHLISFCRWFFHSETLRDAFCFAVLASASPTQRFSSITPVTVEAHLLELGTMLFTLTWHNNGGLWCLVWRPGCHQARIKFLDAGGSSLAKKQNKTPSFPPAVYFHSSKSSWCCGATTQPACLLSITS